jgi:hypothetical protein
MTNSAKVFNGKRYDYDRTVKGKRQTDIYMGMQKKIGLLARKIRIGTSNNFKIYTRNERRKR